MPFCNSELHTMHVASQAYDCWCMTLIPDESARLPAAACSSGGNGVAVFYRFKGESSATHLITQIIWLFAAVETAAMYNAVQQYGLQQTRVYLQASNQHNFYSCSNICTPACACAVGLHATYFELLLATCAMLHTCRGGQADVQAGSSGPEEG
jgi:hypothetical protein